MRFHVIFSIHLFFCLLLSLYFIICITVAIFVMLLTDTSQQISKAEDYDGVLSPVNLVISCLFCIIITAIWSTVVLVGAFLGAIVVNI